MTVDKIVVLADKQAELQLKVFLRTLRDVKCELPVKVIPYGSQDWELPAECSWIEDSKLLAFLRESSVHPLYRKYATLLQRNIAYFDTDIVLLREPRSWLESAPSDAFVVADTEWAKNRWTYSEDSLPFLIGLTSRWPLLTFNSGFFAFESPLYEEDDLLAVIQSPTFRATCLERKSSPIDQPAINWLVLRKQLRIFNFNLPPEEMESTMAVDYGLKRPREVVLNPAAPAFVHFAGPIFEGGPPLTELFTSYLTREEKIEWDARISRRRKALRWLEKWPLRVRVLNRLTQLVDRRFRVQPRF